MIGLIAAIINFFAGIVRFFKPTVSVQEKLGQQEAINQNRDKTDAEILAVAKAGAAVRDDLAVHPDKLRDPDPDSRD